MIRKVAWPFYKTISGVRLAGSPKNLKDLNERRGTKLLELRNEAGDEAGQQGRKRSVGV